MENTKAKPRLGRAFCKGIGFILCRGWAELYCA